MDNWGTIGVPDSTFSTVDLSCGPTFGLVAGQFHHNSKYVGSFKIPPGQFTLQAISDIVVKVMLTNLQLHAWLIVG